MKTLQVLAVTIIGCLTGAAALAQGAGDGAATFDAKCSSCHTVGGGNLTGPDLARVNSWPEADLTSTVQRMQTMAGPLSPDEVKSLVTFLKSANAQNELKAKREEAKAKATVEQDKDPASAEIGQELFSGKLSFENGGMSCISCHASGGSGGTVGADLTTAAARMSESALVTACETTPYKVMKAAYARHPITHQEARHLAAYFQTTKQVSAARKSEPTWLTGSVIAGLTLAVIGIGYRNRNSSVRDKLRRR